MLRISFLPLQWLGWSWGKTNKSKTHKSIDSWTPATSLLLQKHYMEVACIKLLWMKGTFSIKLSYSIEAQTYFNPFNFQTKLLKDRMLLAL